MDLYEYEAKALFRQFRVPVPNAILAHDPEAAASAVSLLGGEAVLKVQVLSGGRGMAGGIRRVMQSEAHSVAEDLFQLRFGGEQPASLLVEEALMIARESYLAVTVDRRMGQDVVLFSPAGGIDVESGDSGMYRLPLEPMQSLHLFECQRFFQQCGVAPRLVLPHAQALRSLVHLYREFKAELAEINPLVTTVDGHVVAADAKVIIDSSAAWKLGTPDRAGAYFSPLEAKAASQGFTFVDLEGDVALFSVGAGLGMLTMDTIARLGGRPANFIDFHSGRGGADWTYDGMNLVLEKARADQRVRSLLLVVSLTATSAHNTVSGIVKALAATVHPVPITACVHVGGMAAEQLDEAGAAARLRAAGVDVLTTLHAAAARAVEQANAVRR
jgi:succinyl-CoA synthetase beta subunit